MAFQCKICSGNNSHTDTRLRGWWGWAACSGCRGRWWARTTRRCPAPPALPSAWAPPLQTRAGRRAPLPSSPCMHASRGGRGVSGCSKPGSAFGRAPGTPACTTNQRHAVHFPQPAAQSRLEHKCLADRPYELGVVGIAGRQGVSVGAGQLLRGRDVGPLALGKQIVHLGWGWEWGMCVAGACECV